MRPKYQTLRVYTTKDVKSCRLMSRIIALIYKGWNLYIRLALPGQHHEAITSRPLLLTSIGRMIKHGDQKKIKITSMHGKVSRLSKAYEHLNTVFNELKLIAPQLSSREFWTRMLMKIISQFEIKKSADNPPEVFALT